MKGYAENAVCPNCRTYTLQRILARGVRECDCGMRFYLADTERIQNRRVVYPKSREVREVEGFGQWAVPSWAKEA